MYAKLFFKNNKSKFQNINILNNIHLLFNQKDLNNKFSLLTEINKYDLLSVKNNSENNFFTEIFYLIYE